ncbi:hypothetical protein Glove_137g151 [Diversispora epigaea]|uniref:Uncharacterized protein n=1 Tax=Diversispora epigaea TaxID=1348612 RepID=A0A397IWE6_9GLOM|nr:hypothetical protein Glove_137g151 [Diversispora epigaea]
MVWYKKSENNYQTSHIKVKFEYKLEKKLNYCGAFKIPQDTNNDSKNLRHICFVFYEALETFGVKFIKCNISGDAIDENNLKNQIKASQDERERVDLLLSEYLDDISISHSERAIKSRKESLWKFLQEVLKIEPENTQGRRAKEVVKPKLKDYNNNKKVKNINTINPEESTQMIQNVEAKNPNELNLNEPINNTTESQTKKRKLITTRRLKIK